MDGPWKVYFECHEGKEQSCLDLIREFTEGSQRAAWYYHPSGEKGKGPHYHGLLINYNKSDDTARLRCKALGLDGRKQQFAVSDKLSKKYGGGKMNEVLTPTYITYMSKGKYEPVMLKGYEKDEIEKLKQQWVNIEKKNSGNVGTIFVKEEKSKGPTQWDLARETQSMYMDVYQKEFVEDGGAMRTDELVRCAIKVLKGHKKLAHKRMVANIVQDIMAETNVDDYVKQIFRMI